MTIDIEQLEALTEARKKTWRALHEAIGADNAARAFAAQCRQAMNDACRADEAANNALYAFIRAQDELP